MNAHGAITNSTASGPVTGNDNFGGLVGVNYGTINESTASDAFGVSSPINARSCRSGGTTEADDQR